MNHLVKKTILSLALASVSFAASAHRGWMLPSTTLVEKEEAWVTIDGAISEGLFEFDHVPLRMDGVTVTDPDGITTPATGAILGKVRSTLDLRLPKDGTYRIAMVSNNVMGSYKVGGETKRFRGTEESVAKEIPAGATDVQKSTTHTRMETFVSAHSISNGALKASGQGLELVPVTNPNDLRAGETAKFRFQLDGKPLANFPFSLVPGGVKYRGTVGEIRINTDAKGEASFTLPAPNRYWVTAKFPVEAGKGPGEPGSRRYAYSATLEVLPE
ncbi:DUF4198 domain-containing protein [Massilia yuzhufengensis]|uniref:Uncharacterized conserved protein, contains GH25 family domain n=1 Tax=Massilia yuzhufengensis TaxID=1164594 RepID=A0A1I1HIZ9_9BURK|nr:DUF4198 domain-containing protein [Massilia yuzhufengensis]SFC21938.1 Uncharacterized conserved protein, contains GH25 family domain [Massilia yuzhufengensis]